jgi:arginase family enzyme
MFSGASHRPDVPADITFIGAPIDVRGSGAAGGPAAVRRISVGASARDVGDAPLLVDLASGRGLLQGVSFADAGDVPAEGADDALTERIGGLFPGTFPIVLGGDATITYGAVRGIQREAIVVVRLGREHRCGDRRACLDVDNVTTLVSELDHVDRLVLIGGRGVASFGHAARARAEGWLGADRLEDLGVERVVESLPVDQPCYVSIDAGVLDRGPSMRTLRSLVRVLGASRPVIGADVNEVRTGADAELVLELVLLLADARRFGKG